jgi:hypothetical protein
MIYAEGERISTDGGIETDKDEEGKHLSVECCEEDG